MVIARMYEEDVFDEKTNIESEESTLLMVEPPEILDDYTKNIDHIHSAYNRSRGDSIYSSKIGGDDSEDFKRSHTGGRSETLYSKNSSIGDI